MKLFPTNLFSSGQNQTSSSPSRSKDNQAFASLMQEESPDLSRQVSNDTSMGRAEEAREVNSRPDQAASKSRRKAEDRDSTTETDSRSTQNAGSEESIRGQDAQSSDSSPEHNQASDQDPAAASSQPNTSESSETSSVASDSSQAEIPSGVSAVEPMAEEIIPLPILQAAVQAPIDGKPIPETNPLIGATLLSPASLGGIEGLEIAGSSQGPAVTADVPVLVENLVDLGQTLTPVTNNSTSPVSAGVTELLPQANLPNPLLQAAQAVPTEGMGRVNTAEALSAALQQANSTASMVEATPSGVQTAQAMLGGSAFQALQKAQGMQGLQLSRDQGPALSTDSDGDGLTLQDLPEAFQEAKSIWTRVDARPTTLQQTTETLSDLPADDGGDSVEIEGELPPSAFKGSRPLSAQGSRLTPTSSPAAATPTQTVADVAQDQSLESRIEFRTTAQNVMMREVGPTPEGHVPALTEVMVEVDEELRVGVRTNGSEVAVSLDGTTRAVEEMRHIGPELQESLENLGFTLSEFSANDEDADFDVDGQTESAKKSAGDEGSARSGAPKARAVRHGMRVDTTA